MQCLGNITGKVRRPDGTGIGGVNVRLFNDTNLDGISDGGTPVRSVFTTAAGLYSMVGLVPGPYVILETQPNGYFTLEDLDESNDNDTTVTNNIMDDDVIPVTIEPQEIDADNVFVDVPSPGIINGYVYQDLDNDNVPDANEGIGGVMLTVYKDVDQNGVADANGFVDSTLTISSGWYAIPNIIPGHYVIFEQQPAGYLNISDIDASNDSDVVPNTNTTNDTIPFTIVNGETDANNYFEEEAEEPECTLVVMNTNDSGDGSLRDIIECAPSGSTITFHSSLVGQVIQLTSSRIEISKNIQIHSDLVPRIMIFSDATGAFAVTAGFTVEMKNIEITSGTGGPLGAGIENYGILTLWDVCVFRHPALPAGNHLIYNSGGATQLIIKGMCHFEE